MRYFFLLFLSLGSVFAKEDVKTLEQKCSAGDFQKCYEVGVMHYDFDEKKEAYKFIKKAYDHQVAKSYRYLGFFYESGNIVEKSLTRARSLYYTGCEKKDFNSCSNLGILYLDNQYKMKNYKRGKKLLQYSCENGSYLGCHNLALVYDLGLGIKKDIKTSIKYFTKACDNNQSMSCLNLGLIHINNKLGESDYYFKGIKYFKQVCDTSKDKEAKGYGCELYKEASLKIF